jgi:hypothetical protein
MSQTAETIFRQNLARLPLNFIEPGIILVAWKQEGL